MSSKKPRRNRRSFSDLVKLPRVFALRRIAAIYPVFFAPAVELDVAVSHGHQSTGDLI